VSSRHCPRQTRTYLTLTTYVKSLISRLSLRRKHTGHGQHSSRFVVCVVVLLFLLFYC
jgi:hypothetical protein